jgi:hypothetical protein
MLPALYLPHDTSVTNSVNLRCRRSADVFVSIGEDLAEDAEAPWIKKIKPITKTEPSINLITKKRAQDAVHDQKKAQYAIHRYITQCTEWMQASPFKRLMSTNEEVNAFMKATDDLIRHVNFDDSNLRNKTSNRFVTLLGRSARLRVVYHTFILRLHVLTRSIEHQVQGKNGAGSYLISMFQKRRYPTGAFLTKFEQLLSQKLNNYRQNEPEPEEMDEYTIWLSQVRLLQTDDRLHDQLMLLNERLTAYMLSGEDKDEDKDEDEDART